MESLTFYDFISVKDRHSIFTMQGADTRDALLAQQIAKDLCALAHAAARDPSSRTPWMHEAAAAGALPFLRAIRPLGGKMDDVTVVIGFLEAAVMPAVAVPQQPRARAKAIELPQQEQ